MLDLASPLDGLRSPFGQRKNLYVKPITYYIDSASGSDSNDGLSAATPVKTWAGLEAKGSLAGKGIQVANGSIFREQVTIPDNSYIIPSVRADAGGRWYVSGADVLANGSFTLTAGKTYTYQISLPSIPSTSNTYVTVSNADVLMVWENNTRLGYTFNHSGYTRPASIADVEATAGSFWWDSTNKILYVHPTGDTNAITNGKSYYASVRTLAAHGGDNFYVEGLVGERAGAKSQTGQQGYGILGYKSGVYYKCVGRWGWNHCGGVANAVASNALTFDTCEFYDHERQSATAASTCFVAYKAGATVSDVIIKDCYVHMDSLNASYSDIGFYSHGSAVRAIWRGTNVSKNISYGRQMIVDSGASSSHSVEDTLVVDTAQYGLFTDTTVENGLTHRVVVKGATIRGAQMSKNCTVYLRAIDCKTGCAANGGTAGTPVTVTLPSPKIINTNAPAIQSDSTGIFSLGQYSKLISTDGLYYRTGAAFRGSAYGAVSAGNDRNEFSGFIRIYSDMDTTYTPGFSTSLTTWKSVSGFDASSFTSSKVPTSDDSTLPAWAGTELGSA